MPLGTDVGLGPGDIVLDGEPAPPRKRGTPPVFRPCLLWPNGCMHQDMRLWNQLPTELKLCQSTALFKRKLKTFLFTASYGVLENNIYTVLCALGQLVGAQYK